jgi:hypothetical protein
MGIFDVQLVYFTALCHILLTFSVCPGVLVYFSHFGMLWQEKSGNPEGTSGADFALADYIEQGII